MNGRQREEPYTFLCSKAVSVFVLFSAAELIYEWTGIETTSADDLVLVLFLLVSDVIIQSLQRILTPPDAPVLIQDSRESSVPLKRPVYAIREHLRID